MGAESLWATEEVLMRLKSLVVIAALAAFGVLALAGTSGAAGGKVEVLRGRACDMRPEHGQQRHPRHNER
jgi:hypothetical protein